MNILLTGSNGFLGNIIKKELFISNNVYTLSRTNSDFNFDLSRNIPFFNMSFDTIIHCAGKAHQIPQNKMDINSFFDVNVNGTINLLNGVSLNNLPKYFIFISSVSVYGLIEGDYICEDAPLLAKDPYGMSKIQAEKITASLKVDKISIDSKKEIIALIAYLQRVGIDIKGEKNPVPHN